MIDVGDSFRIEIVIASSDSFCDANFRSDQLYDRVHLTICSTYSVRVYAQENTSADMFMTM